MKGRRKHKLFKDRYGTEDSYYLKHYHILFGNFILRPRRIHLNVSNHALLPPQHYSQCDLPRYAIIRPERSSYDLKRVQNMVRECCPKHSWWYSFLPTETKDKRFKMGKEAFFDLFKAGDPDTSASQVDYVTIEELLPVRKHVAWNDSPVQVFDEKLDLSMKPMAEALADLVPEEEERPLYGRLDRVPSPFADLAEDPGYPDHIHYSPGVTSKIEILLESPESVDGITPIEEEPLPGPSQGPHTPPYKKHYIYRYNRSSILPVPTDPNNHKPGCVKKYYWSKLGKKEEDSFYSNLRKELALEVFKAKEVFEAYRDQSIALGNPYYLEWERRELRKQRDFMDQFKWELEVHKYFKKTKMFDEGSVFNRPWPIMLTNTSVTHLIRPESYTPPHHYRKDDTDDVTEYPGAPEPRRPFVYRYTRPWKRVLFKRCGETCVPGGYYSYIYDIQPTGEVFMLQQLEFARCPDFHAPLINQPGPLDTPVQKGVLFHLLYQEFSPPPEFHQFDSPEEVEIDWESLPLSTLSDYISHELHWSRCVTDEFFITCRITQFYKMWRDINQFFTNWHINELEHNPHGQNFEYTFDASENLMAKPHRPNPYRGLHNRRDWFYWFVRRKRWLKWAYLLTHQIPLTFPNFDAISMTHYEVCSDWYKWNDEPRRVEQPPNKARIAVVQMSCATDKDENIESGVEYVKLAADKSASMIFFPEAFDFVATSRQQTIEMAETLDGLIITRYRELASRYNIWISLGGFHEKTNELKADGTPWLTNDHIIINPAGEIVCIYRKMHLFDVEIPEKHLFLHESSYIKAGNEMVLTETTPIGRIGLGVCYDVRFPEFSMVYRSQGAHVLTFPSCFTYHTGEVHWEALIRARAIENQCFVIAAAQCGEHNTTRMSWGHSMVVDPWGTVLATADGQAQGIMYAEIDLHHLEKVRREMPVITHRIAGIPAILANPIPPPPPQEMYRAKSSLITNVTYSLMKGEFVVPTAISGDTTFLFGSYEVKYQNVFLENRSARAFTNRKCVVPGHVLVSTKRVAKRMEDLTQDEVSDLFVLAQKVEEIIESKHNVNSSTVTVQDGKDAGQTVEHIHCHVVPRTKDDFKDNDSIYKELATHDKGPDVKWRPYEEMKQECDDIRAHIFEKFSHLLTKPMSDEPISYATVKKYD